MATKHCDCFLAARHGVCFARVKNNDILRRRALNATCRTQCAEVYRPALNLASSCRELPRSKLTEGSYAHRIRSWRGGNSPAAKISPLVGPLFRGWGVELLDRDSSVSRFWGCRGRIKQRRVPGPDRDVESSSIEVPSWVLVTQFQLGYGGEHARDSSRR